MDGIQSWSGFEQQRRQGNKSPYHRDTSIDAAVPGIDALYFSSSSPDIAPITASLLRHSGLTAGVTKSKEAHAVEAGNEESNTDEEFKFRFHWMRPHPSLAFALEDALLTLEAEAGTTNGNDFEQGGENPARGECPTGMKINPAIESSRLMEAYRSSQMSKARVAVGENHDRDDPKSQSSDSSKDTGIGTARFPLELPKLRINLANLIEPPLMTSWLPGEDYDISCEEGEMSE